MYASVRRYTANAGANRTLASRVEQEFIPQLKAIPGFVSYAIVDSDPENGRDVLVTVSTFATRDGAEESARRAAKWVGENFKDLGLSAPQITSGNVIVSAGVQAESSYTK